MTQQTPALADLHQVRPRIYWTDMLGSAALGWAAFAVAVRQPFGTAAGIAAIAVAVFALFRALAFTHEISHQRHRLPGFETAWNWLIGYTLLLPSFMYAEVHFDHHRAAIYGTKADPEYLPFARSARMTAGYLLQTLFIPWLLCLRFLILGPIALVVPKLEHALIERASAIAINHDYRREATEQLIRVVRRDTLRLLALWVAVIALLAFGLLPLRAIAVWSIVTTAIIVIDGLRTLAAHEYESDGATMDKAAQTADSIDIPGGIWTELWAPVGLRFHATHHAYPGIPYHALPAAYRRLTATLPDYGKMTRPGLLRALATLWRKGLRAA
jgi:fatty acid desaturase